MTMSVNVSAPIVELCISTMHSYLLITPWRIHLALFHLQKKFNIENPSQEWKIGPTVWTLCEHLVVSFAIRMLRKQTGKFVGNINWGKKTESDDGKAIVPADSREQEKKAKFIWKWGIGRFVLSGILAYIDGRLCRSIPNHVARRIVSGFLLSFLDKNDSGW